MNAFEVQALGMEPQLPKHIDKLKHKIEKRDARIAGLASLVERQMTVIDRYDNAAGRLSARIEQGTGAGRKLSGDEYERLIGLLDRAIVRAEHLTLDKQSLQTSMENVLGLLDRSLKNQEQLAARAGAQPDNAAPAAAPGPGEPLVATVSRYDSMLERSLTTLENVRQTNDDQKNEIERLLGLLDRSLKNQEQLVARAAPQPLLQAQAEPSKAGEALQATVSRYDSMLERSLAALESARQTNESHKQEIERRDRYLNQTLDVLQNAIQVQERMAERQQAPDRPAAATDRRSTVVPEGVESTLARYDTMLEQTLTALEKAHRTNAEQKQQVEQRDRLLSKTLDTLQTLVEEEAAADVPSEGVWARLFR